MKKLNYLIVLALFVSFFSSCKKDTTTLPAPVITFTNGLTSTTLAAGVTQWDITGTITSDEGLTSVKFFKVTSSGETQIDAAITSFSNDKSFNFTKTITGITANTVIKVQATDAKDQTTSANYTINIAANTPAAYNNIILGSYNSPTGSSFASLDGTVYSLADAKTNSSKVDLVFYWSSVNNASISAPADLSLLNVYFTTASAPNTWLVQNNTKLLKVTTITFATATISQINALNPTDLNVSNLAVNDVFAFQTAATNTAFPNKKGIAQVVSISGTGGTATITLNVKVAN